MHTPAMRYFYLDENQCEVGPFTVDQLEQLFRRGLIQSGTELISEDGLTKLSFEEVSRQVFPPPSVPPRLEEARPGVPPRIPSGYPPSTSEHLRDLVPHLMVPLEEVRNFSWLENQKLLWVAAVGLFPLIIIALFTGYGEVKMAYWGMALYFSVLWAIFFYFVFPAPEIRVSTAALCFFGTGLISISILLIAYSLPPLSWMAPIIRSPFLISRAVGFIFGVGVPEELCKAFMIFFIARRTLPWRPQSMLFYGLMAGLGFGIYEGVAYQTGYNQVLSRGMSEYYLLNLIRLTTLPFLHAVWTGIAGYFIGFAYLYPARKAALVIVAIGLPAVLHGLYDTFGTTVVGIAFAFLSVLALNLYLAKSLDFEKVLRQ